jgi:hypothetical protein
MTSEIKKRAPDLPTTPSKRRGLAPLGLVFALIGVALFAYFVGRAGPSKIIEYISRLGAGFLLILGISAIRHTVRAFAWTRCFEGAHRLRFRDALAARLMGDALGNIIPIASIAVGEPSKAVFVRHRVPLLVGLSALALENIFYSLSVIIFIFSGAAALLVWFPLPKALRYASFGAMIGTALAAGVGYFVISRQWKFISGALTFLAKRRVAAAWFNKAVPRARTLEDRVYGFYERNRGRLLPIFALECCFHLAGVLEVYTTLKLISDVAAPTLLTAFILESVNRIINMTFKFVPLRTGFDEAGTGMLSKVLGFTEIIGVTLAIVRKGRDIFWATIGITLILRRGLSLKAAAAGVSEESADHQEVGAFR